MWVVTTIWKSNQNRSWASDTNNKPAVFSTLGTALSSPDCEAVIVYDTETKTTETHFPEGDK